MLVKRDLGFPSPVLLIVVVPVIVLILHRKWRHSVARSEEVKRLLVSASEESARVEFEAREAYYYTATPSARVSVSTPTPTPAPAPTYSSVPLVSPLKPQYQCAVCFCPTTTRCAKCKAVRYCSGKCQIVHWRQGHKDECRPYVTASHKDNNDGFENFSASVNSENFETVKSGHPTLVNSTRKSTVVGDNNDKKSNLNDKDTQSETSGSFFCSNDGSNESSLSEPSTNSSGFWDEANCTTKGVYNSNIMNKFSASEVIDDITEKSKDMVKDGSKCTYGILNHRDGGIDDDLSTSNVFISVRSGSKASKLKVVDHVKPSKLSRQESLEEGSETHKYSFKGLFSYELFVKLYNWKQAELQPCGLKNCGNSCYANAVLQCLLYTPPLTAYLLEGLHSKACDKRGWCFTCEFEGLVNKAKDGNSPLSPIRILENIGSNLGRGKEEDAHEFLRYFVDELQSVCIKEAGTKALNSLEEETTLIGLTFGGYLRSKIICMKCGGKSERHERMMDLTVEIEGDIGTLEEALDKFTCTENLDGQNKYKCTRCKSYEKAKKKLTLLEAPNVLTIALKRFQPGKYGKLNKSIYFPEILDMAPYLSGTSDKSPIYRLYGVVVHVDTMNAAFSGHYVSYVKNLHNRWFMFDDTMVKEVELQHVLTKGAYMLLYARCSPRAPRSIRDPTKHKTPTSSFVPKPHSTEPWDTCNYHPHVNHRILDEDSSSSSDHSGFFSESSCSCTTEEEHDYNRNINLNSSDSDTSSSSTSSFASPLYSRLSNLYNSANGEVCRNLDCSCSSCRVTNLDRLGVSVTVRRSTAASRKSN